MQGASWEHTVLDGKQLQCNDRVLVCKSYTRISIFRCFLVFIIQILGSKNRRNWKWDTEIYLSLFQSISLSLSVFLQLSLKGLQRTSVLDHPFWKGKVKPRLNVSEEDIQLVKVGSQGLGRREMKRVEGKNCLAINEWRERN